MENVRLGEIDFLNAGKLLRGGRDGHTPGQHHEIFASMGVQGAQDARAQFIDNLILTVVRNTAVETDNQLARDVIRATDVVLCRDVAGGGINNRLVVEGIARVAIAIGDLVA